jgi:hypothetical protein
MEIFIGSKIIELNFIDVKISNFKAFGGKSDETSGERELKNFFADDTSLYCGTRTRLF